MVGSWDVRAVAVVTGCLFIVASANAQNTPRLERRSDIPYVKITNPYGNGLFFYVGGAFPTNNPELIGNAQNLDLNTGFIVGGGPFISIPIGQVPGLGTFSARFGVDVFYSRLNADQITNQFAPGVLPVGGSWERFGAIPTVGIAFLTDSQFEVIVRAGFGSNRQKLDLPQTGAPLLGGSKTTGVFRIGGSILVPVTNKFRAGVFVNYDVASEIDTVIFATGNTLRFGAPKSVTAGITGTYYFDEFESFRTLAP